VVDALLHCQADPFIKNKNGSSPIHLAISSGHYKIVGILLKKNPNLVNSKNELNGWYPIHTGTKKIIPKFCFVTILDWGS
jgi:ankyrin repeat protein